MHIEIAARPENHVSTGVRDFVLNKSTLNDVHKVLGSKGFTHDSVPFVRTGEGMLILNSGYRIKDEDNAVLWFVAMTPPGNAALDSQSIEAASAAILAAVALSDSSYFDLTMGVEKTSSPGEKPVEIR
jgi:hypothetical protein